MKHYLILFSVLLIAILVRFYNFSDRITFGPEQARSLMVSANYISDKPSLLGQEYFRANSLGHKLFTSALFNYTLVPPLLVTNYDPYPITVFFAILNIFTAAVLYILSKKMFGKNIALISIILFLFNSYMVYHSMFIWVLNYLPLLGTISIYLLWKIINKKHSLFDNFWLGVVSGVGFGLEYLYLIAILIALYIILKFTKEKWKSLIIFVIGGVVGDFPQVIFDLRHNFYHLTSLWQYALDTFTGSSDAGFTYYHFLEFWPAALLFLAIIVWIIYKKSKLLGYLVLALYLFLNIKSSLINFSNPVGMVSGLKFEDLKKTSQVIAQNVSENFNVVTLYDFDTRGYTLRYLVQHLNNKIPQNDVTYQNVGEIYALAESNYDFKNNNPWELNVFKPYNIERLENIGDGYTLFKLTK